MLRMRHHLDLEGESSRVVAGSADERAVAAAHAGCVLACRARAPARPPLKDAIQPPPAPDAPFSTGEVDWHPSFDEACEAAMESGKPVLLFQLLGRLDEEFC